MNTTARIVKTAPKHQLLLRVLVLCGYALALVGHDLEHYHDAQLRLAAQAQSIGLIAEAGVAHVDAVAKDDDGHACETCLLLAFAGTALIGAVAGRFLQKLVAAAVQIFAVPQAPLLERIPACAGRPRAPPLAA